VRKEFEAFTRAHVGTYLAIVFDGELISCPIIRSAIPGEGVIEGGFDRPGGKEAAEKLAILINSRPMPFDLECVDSTIER
jgi:SecD/SecF fusion protein